MTGTPRRSLLRLAVLALATSVLVAPSASARPLSPSAAVAIPTASAAALADANELIREPWGPLLPTITAQAQAALSGLNGDFMHGSGKVGNAKWSFGLGFSGLQPHLSLANPPGFTAAGPNGFSIRAPLNGSWTLGITGSVNAHADASAFGKKLASGAVSVPFALSLSKLSLAATADLDSGNPARPKLRSATIDAHLAVGGSGFLPQPTFDVQLARGSDGSLNASLALTKTSVKFAGVAVDVRTNLTIKLLPYSADFAASGSVPGVSLSANGTLFYVLAYLGGDVTIHFPSPVGAVDVPFPLSLLGQFPLPVPNGLGEMLRFAGRGSIPGAWPTQRSSNPLGTAPAPPAGLDFSTLRDTLEGGIASRHMPYGAVLSIDAPRPVRAGRQSPYTYGLEADSTIWTGHYLAAEAFRYAATHSPDALQRVQSALGGISTDFAETADAVMTGVGKYAPVASSTAGAVFARNFMPGSDIHGWSTPVASRVGKQCLYVTSSKGWKTNRGTYPTLARARQAQGAIARLIQPVSPAYGTGCGSSDADNPISRDQYGGLFMGLAYAYALVPDVRPQVKALVDKSLGYLLDSRHQWDVPLPPDNLSRTSFLGGFDAQLALLRIGATVDPDKFGAAYDAVKEASALAWIPIWFSTVDPVTSYFKFNLDHAFLGPALFLETDPTVRQNLLAAYGVLRAPTATHRNAWFDAVDILAGASSAATASASNSSLTLGDEINSDLNDWMTRWSAVKNPNGDGMPTNTTSTSAANALAGLWPNDVAPYSGVLGGKSMLTTFPLPAYDRTGDGMDFIWQRSPFGSGVDSASSKRKVDGKDCGAAPPSAPQIVACSSSVPVREGPGVDFLAPYWLAVYLNVLPR